MAQLRQDFEAFAKLSVKILVVGPEDTEAFRTFWQKEKLPFIGLPDPQHAVLRPYGQEVKLLKLGRMPAQFLIDRKGLVRFAYYSNSMADITDNAIILTAIRQLRL
ncbi:MAG: redoxin domain-containing protein [Desulfobulbaceae bacterium]|nr:redoxin domain-containing protein [Desulfobulbaceae bacterium]